MHNIPKDKFIRSSSVHRQKTASTEFLRRRLLSLPKPSSSLCHFHHGRRGRKRRKRRETVDMSHFEGGDLRGLYFENEEYNWNEHAEEEEEEGERRPRLSSRSRALILKRKRKLGFTVPCGNLKSIEAILSLSCIHWDFNAFTLDRLSNRNGLASLCTHLFHVHGLLSTFDLDPLIVWKFFSLVESGYRITNPYHNGIHATDVTQAMNLFLQEPLIKASLTPLELMSALIAAATHDLDHPGVNEKFLVGTKSHLAALYYEPDVGSLLENHHWRSALSCMHEAGLTSTLSLEQFHEVSELIKSAILATDIAKQGEYLTKLTNGINEGEFTAPLSKSARAFIVQIAMKCADISNPCRAWNISRLWSYRASEEFFRQGDKERNLALPLTPPFDRLTMTVAKIQTGFYRLVASPLFEEWNRFLGSSLSNAMMHNLTTNHARWDLIIQQEQNASPSDSLMTSSTSSSSSSQVPNNNNNDLRSYEPLSHSDGEPEDGDASDRSYPYLPLDSSDSSSALQLRRRFSLPLSSSQPCEDAETLPSTLRLGHKRRLFAEDMMMMIPPPTTSHRVTFHLGHSLDETATKSSEDEDETGGPNKVPKIFEEDKENTNVILRRGSAPSDLLLNQIASYKKRNTSTTPGSKGRDVSPGTIINSSKDPIIVRVNHQRHSRLRKIDRRRGSLPVFSPSDFRRIEEELRIKNDKETELVINASSSHHHSKFNSCSSASSSTTSSSSSSKRTSSSSLVINPSPSSSKDPRRKILRRKSGGSETLLSSSNLCLDKSFLRRGSLRLGEYHAHPHQIRQQRHIVVSQETLLDELIKFSSSASASGIPPRVQILRGLSPAVESELLQKFRTNLALNNNTSNNNNAVSGFGVHKRSPLTSTSVFTSNKNRNSAAGKGRRGSLPTELLSFV